MAREFWSTTGLILHQCPCWQCNLLMASTGRHRLTEAWAETAPSISKVAGLAGQPQPRDQQTFGGGPWRPSSDTKGRGHYNYSADGVSCSPRRFSVRRGQKGCCTSAIGPQVTSSINLQHPSSGTQYRRDILSDCSGLKEGKRATSSPSRCVGGKLVVA